MRVQDIIRLILLAAIWGGSFIFMRILAPVLGPIPTADLRVLLAGVALIVYFWIINFDPEWRKFWRHYLIIGAINSALPFVLYSFAALHIPASYSVIFNSTAPIFASIFSVLWLGDKFSNRKLLGLLLGTGGVIVVARISSTQINSMFLLSIVACLGAAICYGLAGIYIKKFAPAVKPMAIAGGSQLMAGLLLLPPTVLNPTPGEITPFIVMNVICLAIICSAVAYLLYYRLISDIGPTKALTVTFLMPVFGIVWGAIFLGEAVTPQMLLGAGMIIGGTNFVVRA